jgi:MoaA/NifB/PqqE/SkfB family radical SAM enzyme
MATVHNLTKLAIQWQIGNRCNFKCDYCHPDYYDGSNPFFTTEQLQTAFDNLQSAVEHLTEIEIEFQGGEPTASESVRAVIDNCTDPRFKFILTTNGSADIDWWTRVAPKFKRVMLAYHGQDPAEFDRVVQTLKRPGLTLFIISNAPPDSIRWQRAVEVYERYKPDTPIQFKALYANYARGNDKFFDYSPEQWDYYTRVNNIVIPKTVPTESKIEWVQDKLYDNYNGHLCWAGVEQIVIDYFGYAYRGWCHAHGSLGNLIEGKIVLDPQPKVCPKSICKNGFDKQARKSTNSWGLS